MCFTRINRRKSPLTLEKLESLSSVGLANFVEMTETSTLYRIVRTFDFLSDIENVYLSPCQKEIQLCVFWELYFRELPQEQQESDDLPFLEDLHLHHDRFLNAKKIGNMKQMLVNEKRRLRKEAWIAEICENASRRKYGHKLSSRKTRDREMQDVN